MLVLFMYITRLASNEIFSPSNKIHREVGRAKDLSAHLYGRARQVAVGNMILCMRFSCWITNAADTHSEYDMLIAFPWQLWLHLYVHCLFFYIFPEKQFLTFSLISTAVAEGKSWGHTRKQAGWSHYVAAVLRQTLPHWHL
jgi:hypothetical protein